MNRSYVINALSDCLKAEIIEREIAGLDGVSQIRITEDLKEMNIEMDTGKVSQVMERVVNICSRVSNGCEVKYKFS